MIYGGFAAVTATPVRVDQILMIGPNIPLKQLTIKNAKLATAVAYASIDAIGEDICAEIDSNQGITWEGSIQPKMVYVFGTAGAANIVYVTGVD